MASKITYEDKKVFQNDPSIPENQKVKADDMNEIKKTVNSNADTLDSAVKRVEKLEKGEGVSIAVGKTMTGEAGTDAVVENSGTSTNAIFNFTIPKGDKGPKGDPGKDGKDGTGVNILGSYNSLEELNQAHSTGNLGDAYLIQGELYVWSQTESNWISGGNIQGPTGPKGEPGPANTLKIGTVNSGTTASATISGNSPNQTLNLVLPKGDKGPKGDPGKQGEQGESGPAGTFSEDEKINLLKLIFPIGSTYITQTNQNPNLILGFGTWERFKGIVSVGLDENDTDGYFNEIGKTGGEKKHTLTIKEMPSHTHPWQYKNSASSGTNTWNSAGSDKTGVANDIIGKTGGNEPHNNTQPYEVVGYMWIRRV